MNVTAVDYWSNNFLSVLPDHYKSLTEYKQNVLRQVALVFDIQTKTQIFKTREVFCGGQFVWHLIINLNKLFFHHSNISNERQITQKGTNN